MNDQELVKWAKICADPEGDCRGCPFDRLFITGFCALSMNRALAARVETLADRCARYAEEIAVMQERERWISVEEALPEGVDWVLCQCADRRERVLCYDCVMDNWFFTVISGHGYSFPREAVTRWMPLPKEPKEVE